MNIPCVSPKRQQLLFARFGRIAALYVLLCSRDSCSFFFVSFGMCRARAFDLPHQPYITLKSHAVHSNTIAKKSVFVILPYKYIAL